VLNRSLLSCTCVFIGTLCFAYHAYASCCTNKYTYSGGGSGGFCSGPSSTVCDQSSPDSNPGKTSIDIRYALCTSYQQANPLNWYSGSCSSPPSGTGWVRISSNGGTCCWVKNPTVASTPQGFTVSDCSGADCVPMDGGGEG
jgi:hypothetical protein